MENKKGKKQSQPGADQPRAGAKKSGGKISDIFFGKADKMLENIRLFLRFKKHSRIIEREEKAIENVRLKLAKLYGTASSYQRTANSDQETVNNKQRPVDSNQGLITSKQRDVIRDNESETVKGSGENLIFVPLSEIAKNSNYSKNYINFSARQGKLKAKKIGGVWHTTETWLEEFTRVSQAKKNKFKEKLSHDLGGNKKFIEEAPEVPERGDPISTKEIESPKRMKLSKSRIFTFLRSDLKNVKRWFSELGEMEGARELAKLRKAKLSDFWKFDYAKPATALIALVLLMAIGNITRADLADWADRGTKQMYLAYNAAVEKVSAISGPTYGWKIGKENFVKIAEDVFNGKKIKEYEDKNGLVLKGNQKDAASLVGQDQGGAVLGEEVSEGSTFGAPKVQPSGNGKVLAAATGAAQTNIGDVEVSVYLLDGNNQEVPNGEYDVRFGIYTTDRTETDPYPSDADKGTRVWEETQKVTVENGLLKTYLGATTPIPANFNFAASNYYIGIRVGQDAEMVPRKRIGAVPLARTAMNIAGQVIGNGAGNIPLSNGTLNTNLNADTLDGQQASAFQPAGTYLTSAPAAYAPWKLQSSSTDAGQKINSGKGAIFTGANGITTTRTLSTLTISLDATLSPTLTGLTLSGLTPYGVIYADGASALQSVVAGAEGQVLTFHVGAAPTWDATPPAGGEYVLMAPDAAIPNGRVLTGTANQVIVTDGGANGPVTLSLPQSIGTTDSPTFAALNTGQGANELYAMNQNVRTIDSPTFVALFLTTLDLGTNTVTDGNFNGNWNFNAGNLSGIGTIGSGNITGGTYNGNTITAGTGTLTLNANVLTLTGSSQINQNLLTTSAPTFATLNTGQGANELFAMDQNVRTGDSPSFTGLTVSGLTPNYPVITAAGGQLTTEQYLSVARGGTGAGSFTQYGVMYGNNAGALQVTLAGVNGQVLMAQTGAAPIWSNTAPAAAHALLSVQHSDTTPAAVQKGDIVTGQGDGPTTWSRLGIGNPGDVLKVSAGVPTWQPVGAAGSVAWSSITDPGANLSLAMAAYTTAFTWNATTGASNLFSLADTVANTGTGYLLNIATGAGSSLKPLHISAAGTEALTILASGNVGIGTTTPGYTLDVNGDTRLKDNVYLNGAGDVSYLLQHNGSTKWFVGNRNATENYSIERSLDGGLSYLPSFVIQNSDGSIGIGTTTPGYKLDIADSTTTRGLNIANSTALSYGLYAAGTQYGVYGTDGTTSGYLGYDDTYGLYTANNAYVGGTLSIATSSLSSSALTFAGAGAISTGAATNLTLDAGTTGEVNIAGVSTGNINFSGGTGGGSGCTIDNAGNLTCSGDIGGGGTGSVGYWTRTGTTLSPKTAGDTVAIYANSVNTSGTLFGVSYTNLAPFLLTGPLIGADVDLNNGHVTPTNQDVTGLRVVLPTTTNTNGAGTITYNGMLLGYGTGTGINQNGAGATVYNGANLLMPALTQTLGSLTANGALITTSSSITTGGTANGVNVAATGINAGSLNGVYISSITGSGGTERAIAVGSGWDSVLTVNGATVINSLGVVPTTAGGTGLTSYADGDLIYANGVNTLTNLPAGAGNNGKVLVVSGGVPTWGVMAGAACPDCVLNDPTSVTNQTIVPNNQDISSLIVRQTTYAGGGGPSHNIFEVTNSTGSSVYFYVDQNGNVSTGGVASQTLTLTPLSDTTALTLVGTNVPTAALQYINAKNTQGTISKLAYGDAGGTTLAAALIGESINLATNVTATDQSVTGLSITLPTPTNTVSTSNYKGIAIAGSGGGGLNQNGAGTTVFSGVDVTIPALTQTAGLLTANGVNVATPLTITTGGTANGVNIVATGIGAGTLRGLNISDLAGGAGAGAETAIHTGTGWDYAAIFEAGNVGIGTTSPGSKLDISGSARIYDQTAVTGVSTLTIRAGAGQATSPLAIWQNNAGTGLGAIDASGNIGIGTTTPGQKIDVVGGSIRTDNQFISTLAIGTAPLAVTSTTLNTNLNADLLDGLHKTSLGASLDTNGNNIRLLNSDASTLSTITAPFATNASQSAITDDTTTDATMYPTWVTANTGNLPLKVTSSRLTFNPSTGTLAATFFSGSGASLTALPAGQLSGTIPSGVLGNSAMFIGTTSQALNRASAPEGLSGITGLTPGADFTLTQNSVAALTSVEAGAIVNTLYLKAGNVGIGTTTPGAKLNVVSTDNAWTTATLFGTSLTQSAATGTSVSGNIASIAFNPTYSTAITNPAITGNVLNVSRNSTTSVDFASTLTVSGAVASFSDTSTQTQPTLTSTADVVQIAQNYSNNTGAALNINGGGGAAGFALRVNDNGSFTDTTPFVIDNAGNVGIGTTTPAYKLEVIGSVNIPTGSTYKVNGVDVIGLWGAYGSDIANTNSGNVGIGTTTPAALLHVVGSKPAVSGSSPGTVASAVLTVTGGAGGDVTGPATGVGGIGSAMTLTTGAGGIAGSAITASTGGAAGTLALAGGIGGAANVVGGGVNLGGAGGAITLTGGAGGAAATGATSNTGGAGGDLTFNGGTGGAGATANGRLGYVLLQTGGGNVGIGTTTPGNKLDVRGTAQFTDTGTAVVTIRGNGSSEGEITTSNVPLCIGANGNCHINILTSGNVGIGTTTPGALLHVAKNDANAGTYIKTSNSTAGASSLTGFYAASDGGSLYMTQLSTSYSLGAGYELLAANRGTIYSNAAGGLLLAAPDAAGVLVFGTGGYATANERMRITSGGNVGIGTTSPDDVKLDIHKSATTAYSATAYNAGGNLKIGFGNADQSYGLIHFSSHGDMENDFGVVQQGASGQGDFIWQTWNGSTYGERMRITKTGNVGIGTTAPGSKLEVIHGESIGAYDALRVVNRVQLYDNDGGGMWVRGGPGLAFSYRASDINTDIAAIYGITTNTTNGNLVFHTLTGGSLTEKVRVDSSGNVGIGTTSPGAKLELAGGVLRINHTSADLQLYDNNANSGNRAAVVRSSGDQFTISGYADDFSSTESILISAGLGSQGSKVVIGGSGIGAGSKFNVNGSASIGSTYYTVAAPSDGMIIQGNVGIGTTNPGRKLFVNGDAGGTTGWYNDSDANLKKNISTIPDALQKVMELRGVSYEWKDPSRPAGEHVGFLAQEVQTVVPEVVSKGGANYGVDYSSLVPLTVNAIQEQQGMILNQQNLISQNTAAINSQQTAIADVNLKTSQNIETVQQLQKSVDQNLVVISNNFAALNSQVSTLNSNITKNTSDISALGARTASLEQNTADISRNLSELTATVGTMSETESMIVSRITDHETRIAALEAKILAGASGTTSTTTPSGTLELSPGLKKFDAALVASLDASGNPVFTLAGTFKAQVLGAESLKLGSQTSGSGKIKSGDAEVVIPTSEVKSDSKIYITPTDSSFGKVIYAKKEDITEGESFKVKFDGDPAAKDIPFNWLIVN